MKRILTLMVALVFALSLAGCAMLDYKSSEKSFEAGDYKTASEKFKALGDYKNSAALAVECDYLIADGYYNDGDLELALSAYEELGAYKDSADMAAKVKNELMHKRIIGSWRSEEIDGTEIFLSGIGDSDISKFIRIDKFTMFMIAAFNEDGSFSVKVDTESFLESVYGAIDAVAAGFEEYMAEELEKEAALTGNSMDALYEFYEVETVRELIEKIVGMDIGEYVRSLFGDDMFIELAEEMTVEGSYTLENGILELSSVEGAEHGEFDMDADTLTFISDSSADSVSHKMYPMVFLRAETSVQDESH